MPRLDEIIAHYEGLGCEWDAEGWVFRSSHGGALTGAPRLSLQAALEAMPGEAAVVDRPDPVLD